MKNLKPVLWMAVGIVVGASGASLAKADTPQQKRPAQRMQTVAVSNLAANTSYFIKDSKSGACWLAIQWTSEATAEMSLAPAPKEACD